MATIQDVALRAGVSVATVSHVVNKTRYVSPDTVKRVEEAIDSLDELPNFIVKKRGVNQQSAKRYLLIFASSMFHPFQKRLIEHLNEELQKEENIHLVVVQSDDMIELIANYVVPESRRFIGKVVLVDKTLKNSYREHSSLKGIPTVIVSENPFQLKESYAGNVDFILSNIYQGAYDAIKHLINYGHEKISLLQTECDRGAERKKIYQGYKEAFLDNKVPFNKKNVLGIESNRHLSEDELAALMRGEDAPTALLITNEHSLMTVLKYLKSRNLRCPDDLSIICINDLQWFEFFQPEITTVQQNCQLIAEKIVDKFINKTEQTNVLSSRGQTTIIDTKLKLRSSTGGIAKGPFGEKAASVNTIQLTANEKKSIKENKHTAVISFHYSGAAWMHLHERGIRDLFNELGISILAVTDAHFDAEMQNKQLKGLLSLDPDIVIAIPVDDSKTSNIFKEIAKSRSQLILITNVPKGMNQNDYVSCVSVNEWSHGRLAGSGLGSSMRELAKFKIGMIRFDSDFYATNQRDTAAKQMIMKEYDDLEIVKEIFFKDEKEVFDKTVRLIKDHPEIEGLYVSWEGPAIKAVNALSSIGRNDIIIGTADLDYDLALNMAERRHVKKVSAQLPYEQGQALALVAANAMLNKSVPKFIGVEPVHVSRDNLMKTWKKVFKENAPEDIVNAIKEASH
ncbi:LacI family DNA-binding transcriptional regulator [Shouchella shacheensis]|uniref:LacI family DNA-binding transcriptional regulator n=1 Tax=Shouchella shacheensis TaxID=1649580 RepID=UPI00074007AF|nr:LacI family DNA-binding transcriptional regulator [Shouchella shacheensis]